MNDAASQRGPLRNAPADQGHRKLAFGLGTFLGGEIAGQDIVKFLWDSFATLANGLGVPLDPMPEKIAAGLFTLAAFYVFYKTKENRS